MDEMSNDNDSGSMAPVMSPPNPLKLLEQGITAPKMSWLQLAFLAYAFTAAGPFGMEALVRAAGPRYALMTLFAVPVVFAAPQILIVSELATMMPTNHGAVLWVHRAFGDLAGFYNCINKFVSTLFELAIYPSLFASYVSAAVNPNPDQATRVTVLCAYVCIGVGFAICLLPAKHVGNMSLAMSVVVVAPFIIGALAALPRIRWSAITDPTPRYNYDHPGQVSVGLMISDGVWLYTGWRVLGTMGGEVSKPTDFLRGMPTALVVAMLSYSIPLAVALSVSAEDAAAPVVTTDGSSTLVGGMRPWEDGYLASAFNQVVPGLGAAITTAGAFGMLLLYSSSLLCYSRMAWGIAERGWLPAIFSRRRASGSPVYCMALYLFTSCFLALLNFDVLVRAATVIEAGPYILGVASLAKLRWSEPAAYRPIQIPRAFWGSIALVTMPIVTFACVFLFNLDSVGISLLGIGINATTVVAFVWLRKRGLITSSTDYYSAPAPDGSH